MRQKKKGNSGHLIHRKLSEILLRESKDPRFQRLTITRVEAANDFSFATVYFSIYPPEHVEELSTSLNHAAGFFSQCLGRALTTRNTPRLAFVYDAGFDYSFQIDVLLKQVAMGKDTP